MKRRYDTMLPGDLNRYCQGYDTPEEAAKFCRLVKKVAPNSKIHVRRGTHVVVTTHFSADAWVLTFNIALTTFKKLGMEAPQALWGLANSCVWHAQHHKTWFPEEDTRRIACRELLQKFYKIQPSL